MTTLRLSYEFLKLPGFQLDLRPLRRGAYNHRLPVYSKAEASQLRQAFWTTFGQYMAPVLSAEGVPTNWINYKTGLKGVRFALHADNRRARIGIELTQADAGVRELFFEQLVELKTLLREEIGEDWRWELHGRNEHDQPVACIYRELVPANVFSRDDWPALISFFKPRLIALDAFWSGAQYAFEELREL